MTNRIVLLLAIAALLISIDARAQMKPSVCAPPIPAADAVWRFAVSGDSRNCGDLVMPAIAKDVLAVDNPKVDFYWHLGDFRRMSDIDADMRKDDSGLNLNEGTEKPLCETQDCFQSYRNDAWTDFIDKQLRPFGKLPIYLGIGNHELPRHSHKDEVCAGLTRNECSRKDYLETFSQWVDSPFLKRQRCGDSASQCPPKTYYHWQWHQVDFIDLDNADEDGFAQDQMEWFKTRLEADKANPAIRTVVVGMHRALPNSWACAHSMNGDPKSQVKSSIDSGRSAYELLLDFRQTGRRVYVIASHSHFVMTDVFDTPYWHGWQKKHGKEDDVLCGAIIGTAGAHRYPVPTHISSAKVSKDPKREYGYFLATVNRHGAIGLEFRPITQDAVRKAVPGGSQKVVDWCSAQNIDDYQKEVPASCKESP